jgi:hypothetical protein
MSRDEKMMILQMVQTGKISATEGAELLRALGAPRSAVTESEAPPIDIRTCPDNPDAEPVGRRVRASGGGTHAPDFLANLDLSWLAGMFGGGGDVFKFEETYEGEFEAGAAEITLNLRAHNGRIELKTWDRPGYRIILTRRARGRDEEEARERSRQLGEIAIGSTTVTLRAEEAPLSNTGISMEAWLPGDRKYQVSATSANGRVQAFGLLCGQCVLKTANGRIVAEGVQAERIDADTANGRIDLKAVAPNIRCSTSNGSVHLDATGEIAAETFEGKYECRTSNGSIKVRLPDGQVAGAVEARTSVGSITAELPDFQYEVREKDFTRRYIKGHTAGYDTASRRIAITATTANGSITISR